MTDQRISTQIEAEPVAATLTRIDDRWVLTMTRDLAYPPERVWRMLTDPERLARWSPVIPDRDLGTLGPAQSHERADSPGIDAEVMVADAPHELVHRWGTHILSWRLTPTADGTRLTLSDTLDGPADGSRNGAGWHICLGTLAAHLDDDSVERVIGADARSYGWDLLDERYRELLGTG